MAISLTVKKYNQEGDMAHEYRPLRNKLLAGQSQELETGQQIKPKDLTDFRTKEILVDLDNPLNIECQPSYDGTVNLIINDDKNPPRIINTRFSAIEDNRYRIINRNQKEQTNLYEETMIDQQTRLFRNLNAIPRIQFMSVDYFGQLKGGNYTFYVKFADNDFNKTDVVCESGQISVFNGTLSSPRTIMGTLQDERTDKAISIRINNIDTSFQKIYLYYTRETSDPNGARITESAMIKEPYDIKNSYLDITVNGFEEVQEINEEELNIKYLYVDRVKTQAQNQGMLFFGNVEMTTVEPRDFQALSLYINVALCRKEESIGYIDTNYNNKSSDDSEQTEYYNPQNIYYNLGYWPDEMYRLGIVYIMRDDSLSEVFNLRGVKFNGKYDGSSITGDCTKNIEYDTTQSALSSYNNWWAGITDPKDIQDGIENPETHKIINGKPVVDYKITRDDETNKITSSEPILGEWEDCSINYVPKDDFILNGQHLDNIMGVFKMPKNIQIYNHESKETHPWGFKISFPEGLLAKLRSMGVKGFFIVRQKRIPTILCQGLSVGIDRAGHVPTLPIYNSTDKMFNYITEGFIDDNGTLSTNFKKKISKYKATSALLSIDSCVTPMLQSTFDGSEYTIQEYEPRIIEDKDTRVFTAEYDTSKFPTDWKPNTDGTWQTGTFQKLNTVYVASDVPFKYMANQSFSTRAGAAEEVKQIAFFDQQNYKADNRNLLRGIWCPFLGLSNNVKDGWIYNVKIRNFSSVFEQEYFKIRGNDNSPFYAITDRYSVDDERFNNEGSIDAYRGDCYTCTVSMRLQRNFTDSDVPVNEIIIDPNTWKDNYAGYNTTSEDEWLSINRGDVNTCPIGSWITWKCFSNYNLGLRSQDYTNVEEMALMGNPRSFYPITGASTSVANKIEESWKLNDGYSSTVGKKRFLPVQDVPYTRDIFDTRIMFSNVQQDDAFQNAYRIFQGLSYKDMDRQYGGLVKLLTWGSNLLAIFEHGITIIPVNEKALLSTNTGQSIHMYGAGVLQNQMTVISQDYGSIWPESIIRTPIGVYGVDTYAKKIWRFSADKNLELISDAKIQRFLNDHVRLKEKDKYPTVALRNVKSHYNNYKGDIMFTFYNDTEDEEWNICYNERLDKWSTRYSWIPLYSDNVNNIYYSLDKKRAEVLAHIYDNINATTGIVVTNPNQSLWTDIDANHTMEVTARGYSLFKYFRFNAGKARSSYIDSDGIEKFVDLPIKLGANDLIPETQTKRWDRNTVYTSDGTGNTGTLSNETDTSTLTLTDDDLKYTDDNGVTHQLYYITFIIEVTPYGRAVDPSSSTQTGSVTVGDSFNAVFSVVADYKALETKGINQLTGKSYQSEYDEILKNGFYVHGRAGIFDEIDYFDENRSKDNQIMPTTWYDKQEPFEFEFVVNEPTGLHKIFNNLVIISNNVQPSEIEYEIVGDVYGFNKAGIFWSQNKNYWEKLPEDQKDSDKEWSPEYNKPIELLPAAKEERKEYPFTDSVREQWIKDRPIQTSEEFKNAEVEWDPILNQYLLKVKQPCYDIKNYGRMRGNITYKEDAWYLTIDPILFKKADAKNAEYGSGNDASDYKSTRIRDKWCKIRIKYTGKDLVLISAIKTMIMTSYS